MSLSRKLDELLKGIREEKLQLDTRAREIIEDREERVQKVRDDAALAVKAIQDEARAALDEIAEERKVVGKIVRAVDPPETKPVAAKPKRQAPSAGKTYASREALDTVLRCLVSSDIALCNREMRERTGLRESTIRDALTLLRAEGLARPAGVLPAERKVGADRKPTVWTNTADGTEHAREHGLLGELKLVA